jgi:hypothetical protein
VHAFIHERKRGGSILNQLPVLHKMNVVRNGLSFLFPHGNFVLRKTALAIVSSLFVVAGPIYFSAKLFGQVGLLVNGGRDKAVGVALEDRTADEAVIDSMVQLELFDSALETCQSRIELARSSRDATQAAAFNALAKWSILHMKCLSAQAVASPTAYDRPEQMETTFEAISKVAGDVGDSPRSLWVRHKQEWNHWFVASRMLAAFEAAPTRQLVKDWTLDLIRKRLDRMDSLEAEVAKRPASQGVQKNTQGAPTPAQWLALTNDLQLLKSDFLSVRAKFYPNQSTERIAAATEMLTALDRALQKSGDDPIRILLFEIARCRALLLLNRPDDALVAITAISQKQTSAPKLKSIRVAGAMAAIESEAYRSLGKPGEAEQALVQAGGWQLTPELAIEHFANVVQANQASDALQLKKEIGQRFGRYWEQRSDAILVGSRLAIAGYANGSGKNGQANTGLAVELLMTEAKQWIAAKAWDKAFDKLAQAEQAAANNGDETRAIEIALKAGALMIANQDVSGGRSEFFRAAITYTKESQAADAAMLSVWDFAAKSGVTAGNSELEEESGAIARGRLAEIVRIWPASTQATIACAKLEEHYLGSDDLVSLNQLWVKRLSANPTPDLFDQAVLRFGFIGLLMQDQWMESKVTQSTRFTPDVQEFAKFKSAIEKNAPSEVRSSLATLLVDLSSPFYEVAKRGNQATVMNSKLNLPRYAALTITGTDTNSQLGSLPAIDLLMVRALRCEMAYRHAMLTARDLIPGALPQLETSLSEVSSYLGPRLLERLQRNRTIYQICERAVAKGWSEVQVELTELIRGASKDPWWPYRAARLHLVLGNVNEDFSLLQFRRLAQGLPAGGEAWLEMRSRTVEVLKRMSRADEAKQLSELVIATYPSLPTKWRERFQ